MEQVRQAQRHVEKICRRLEKPELSALEQCEADVSRLIKCLQAIEAERGGTPSLETAEGRKFAVEILLLRRGVSRAQVLLDAAGRFCAGWAHLVALRTEPDPAGGYTSSGAAVIPIDQGTVVTHG